MELFREYITLYILILVYFKNKMQFFVSGCC